MAIQASYKSWNFTNKLFRSSTSLLHHSSLSFFWKRQLSLWIYFSLERLKAFDDYPFFHQLSFKLSKYCKNWMNDTIARWLKCFDRVPSKIKLHLSTTKYKLILSKVLTFALLRYLSKKGVKNYQYILRKYMSGLSLVWSGLEQLAKFIGYISQICICLD